jgi:alpha-glucuronidase
MFSFRCKQKTIILFREKPSKLKCFVDSSTICVSLVIKTTFRFADRTQNTKTAWIECFSEVFRLLFHQIKEELKVKLETAKERLDLHSSVSMRVFEASSRSARWNSSISSAILLDSLVKTWDLCEDTSLRPLKCV